MLTSVEVVQGSTEMGQRVSWQVLDPLCTKSYMCKPEKRPERGEGHISQTKSRQQWSGKMTSTRGNSVH